MDIKEIQDLLDLPYGNEVKKKAVQDHLQSLLRAGYVRVIEGHECLDVVYLEAEEGNIYKVLSYEDGRYPNITIALSNNIDIHYPNFERVYEESLLGLQPVTGSESEGLNEYLILVEKSKAMMEEAKALLETSNIIDPPNAEHIDWNSSSLYC